MSMLLTVSFVLLLTLSVLRFLPKCRERRLATDRLYELVKLEESEIDTLDESSFGGWSSSELLTKVLGDRLGKAGFIGADERKRIKQKIIFCVLVLVFSGFIFGLRTSLVWGFFMGFVSLYFAFMCALFYLRYCAKEFEREVLFQLPLTLETLILLVEAGLGILPALEQIVRTELARVDGELSRLGPVAKVLRIIYGLTSHGMPFAQALELVADAVDIRALRHVLLHLDVSSTEGGALSPALRSLSEFTHTEWKLGVEGRVKRLETAVVFPVFLSVMGLMLLTASVPLVPVLDFLSSMDKQKSIAATNGPLSNSLQESLGER